MKLSFLFCTLLLMPNTVFCQDEDRIDQTLVDDTKRMESENLTAEQKAEVQRLSQQIEKFYTDCGRFPTNKEGLNALIVKPKKLQCKEWKPYITSMPNGWIYTVKGSTYVLKPTVKK